MKFKLRIGAYLLLIARLSACQKDNELDKLDADYKVVTDYDPATDFSNFQSYYLPDSILFIGENEHARYLDKLEAKPILDAFHQNMQNRGYTRAVSKKEADLGLQVTYIANTSHFVGYIDSPYWWWGYPDYWSSFYWGNWGYWHYPHLLGFDVNTAKNWGNWGYWHYPHPVSFSVSTGALLTDMLNLKAEQGKDKQLPVIWQSYLTGLLYGSNTINIALAIRGVDQAFEQSAYIINN